MNLCQAVKNKVYTILRVDSTDDFFISKASQLGLNIGCEISLLHTAPFSKDPLLFTVDGSMVALTKFEAQNFKIQEKNE